VALIAAQAAHEANHDPLTQLPGRRLTLERIAVHQARAVTGPTGRPSAAAAIAINITGFPELTDTCGHAVAEQLLVHTARQLQAAAGLGELIGHLDTDNFAIFCSDLDSVQQARDRARALLAAIAAPAHLDSGPVALSGVAGIAYADPMTTGEDLLRQARVALRQARRHGLDVELYRHQDDTQGAAALVLASELRTALADGQLILDYQPIIELSTGAPVGVEAVPRWLHPSRGLLAATEWMPVLEQTNLIPTYTRWLLETALTARAGWAPTSPALPVGIDLPARALLDPGLPGLVAAALAATGTAPLDLSLELSESRALSSLDTVDRVLGRLASSGVQLVVDDLGSGSLAQLRRIPASGIKLSAEITASVFGRPLADDVESRAITRAVVSLANELDLRVTAQALTSPNQVLALAALGVHAGQGCCLYPPVPDSMIAATLRDATDHAALPTSAEIIQLPVRRDRNT
jgi:diguanylate cyclase (GGDEF)-like protein